MKFSQYPYSRVDIDAFKSKYASLTQRVAGAGCAEDIFSCVEEHEKLFSHAMSMLTIANIRNTIDTRDEFYAAEKAFEDENGPVMEEACQGFMRALYESPFREALEKKYGGLLFTNIAISLKTFDPSIVELLQEENTLTTRYTALIAGARIPFDGKTLTMAQLGPYKIDRDRDVRRAAYCAEGGFIKENADRLDEIFDSLVSVRSRIAEKLGEKSFVDVAYNRNGRNCYGRSDVESFRSQVIRDIVPVVGRISSARARPSACRK